MEPLLELIANAFFIIGTDCQWLPKGGQRCQTLRGAGGGKDITSLLSLSFPLCWHCARQSPHFQTFFGKCLKEGCRDAGSGHLPNVSGTLSLTVKTHPHRTILNTFTEFHGCCQSNSIKYHCQDIRELPHPSLFEFQKYSISSRHGSPSIPIKNKKKNSLNP